MRIVGFFVGPVLGLMRCLIICALVIFTDDKELVRGLIILAVLIFALAVTFLILAYRFR